MSELKSAIALDRVRQLLHYDEATGVFTWVQKCGSKPAGSVAGTPHKGYVRVQVDGQLVRAHRLAWLWMTGEMPTSEIDHANGCKADNRWANLRLVDRHTNMQNQVRAHRNNLTGLLGVHAQDGKFRARIRWNGKPKSLGMYDTPEQAHAAYVQAKRTLHVGCTL